MEDSSNWGGIRNGAGRPKGAKNKTPAQGRKKEFANTTISGTPEEIEMIKQLAKSQDKTVSRFLIDLALNSANS